LLPFVSSFTSLVFLLSLLFISLASFTSLHFLLLLSLNISFWLCSFVMSFALFLLLVYFY
jgi:hypothetical protein